MERSVNALRNTNYSLFYCPEKGYNMQHCIYADWVYGEREEQASHTTSCTSLGSKLFLLANKEDTFADETDEHLCAWSVNDFLVQSLGRLDAGLHKDLRTNFLNVFKRMRVKNCSGHIFRWMSPRSAKAIMMGLCCKRLCLLSFVEKIDERNDFQLLLSFVCSIIELIFKQNAMVQTDPIACAVLYRASFKYEPYFPLLWFVDRKDANHYINVAMDVAVVQYGSCNFSFMDPNTQLKYLDYSVQMCALIVGQRGIDRSDIIMRFPQHPVFARITESCYKMQEVASDVTYCSKKVELLTKEIEHTVT